MIVSWKYFVSFNYFPRFPFVWNDIVLRNKLCHVFATSTRRVAPPVAFFKVLDAKYTELLLLLFCHQSLPVIRQSHLVSIFRFRNRLTCGMYLLNKCYQRIK